MLLNSFKAPNILDFIMLLLNTEILIKYINSMNSINTGNKYHLHRLVANLSCFQKGASYSGVRIFNNLPRGVTSIKNEKTEFKVTLKKFYMHTPFTLWMNFLHVQMICITDLYDCVNPYYTVMFLYVYDMFHILLSCDSLGDPWNVYMYVCM
jgi:hypothetical protein